MLETLTFDLATAIDGRVTAVREGHFPPGTPDWMYLPVAVPDGVRRLSVSYDYDRAEAAGGVPGNALDLAVFDPAGFRGCSGGARDGFAIDAATATPGYAPGPVAEGEWRILLAPYTIAPAGLAYRVEVTLELAEDTGSASDRLTDPPFVAAYAPLSARGRGRAWYRGDMHLHSVHSDGQRSPRDVVDEARSAGLDFMVSTDHNTNTAHAVWGRYVSGPDDELLILAGEEVTTRNGHLVAAGLDPGTWLDWRFRARDAGALAALTERLRAAGGIGIAAHPHAPCLGCQWKYGYDHVDAVEVWNGPWTPDDEVSLQQWNAMLVSSDAGGRWVPAVGDSDSHTTADPIGLPQTVVLADDLTRDAILDGVRSGRCYIAESADITVTFEASGGGRSAGIGERLEVPVDTTVEIVLSVDGVPDGLVRLVTDEGWMVQTPLPPSGTLTWSTTPAVSSYVRAEVRRPGPQYFEPMAAFTNPIFLGVRACTSS